MKDTRLDIASYLLDDARDLLIEIVDEKPGNARDVNNIDSARLFINAAETHIRIAQGQVRRLTDMPNYKEYSHE